MITLETCTKVTEPPTKPGFSPWGYIIQPDGKTYSLHHQYWHGAVLALLYPEAVAQFNVGKTESEDDNYFSRDKRFLKFPEDSQDLNVYHFQDFEHWAMRNAKPKPQVIRVCASRMMGKCPTSVDLPDRVTIEQVEALRLVFKELSLGPKDMLNMEMRDIKVNQVWNLITKHNEQPIIDYSDLEDDE